MRYDLNNWSLNRLLTAEKPSPTETGTKDNIRAEVKIKVMLTGHQLFLHEEPFIHSLNAEVRSCCITGSPEQQVHPESAKLH